MMMALVLLMSLWQADTVAVELSQRVRFKSGDTITLRGGELVVQIGSDPGTTCAVPGFNCGSGYRPPTPTFQITCRNSDPCAYVVVTNVSDATTGTLSIENEQSCETSNPEQCFSEFARLFSDDSGCMKLTTPMGRYYCLQRFTQSARVENKQLCDQLPKDVYALQWNCFYDYAIRFRDPAFCEKYSAQDASGRARCLLKMADLLRDKSYCAKIPESTEHSYRAQCLELK
jgi:hypothetical protein